MTKFEKLSLIIASLGFLISTIALVIGIFSNRESTALLVRQISLEESLKESRVVLSIERNVYQDTIFSGMICILMNIMQLLMIKNISGS